MKGARIGFAALALCLSAHGVAAQVERATVVLYESGIMFRYAVSEERLKVMGCTFTSTSADKVDALAAILARRLAREVTHEGFPNNLRNLVYLYRADGTRLRYTFTDEYDAKGHVYGWVDSGAGDGRPLMAGRELLADLRAWAGSETTATNFRPSCLVNKRSP